MIYEIITELKLECTVSTSCHHYSLSSQPSYQLCLPPHFQSLLCFAYGQQVLHVSHIIVTSLNCIRESERLPRAKRNKKKKKRKETEGETMFSRQGWIQSALTEGGVCVPASCELASRLSATFCLTAQFLAENCSPLVSDSPQVEAEINHSCVWLSVNEASGLKCTVS